MKREIRFNAAYDKRDPNPSKNYGIHGVDMYWFLTGELGAVSWSVFTNWHLPHVEEELDNRLDSQFPHLCCHPQPADISYHSPTPMYEGQTERECSLLPGGRCYCDGSSLQAKPIFNTLVSEGDEAVWKILEERYVAQFGELK